MVPLSSLARRRRPTKNAKDNLVTISRRTGAKQGYLSLPPPAFEALKCCRCIDVELEGYDIVIFGVMGGGYTLKPSRARWRLRLFGGTLAPFRIGEFEWRKSDRYGVPAIRVPNCLFQQSAMLETLADRSQRTSEGNQSPG